VGVGHVATLRTIGNVRSFAGRVLVLVLVAGLGVVRAQGEAPYSVETVKAAFLYRFLEYVDWPIDAKAAGPLTIAVLGDESLAAELDRNVRGRMAHGREIEARAVRTVREGLDAHVLFISASARKTLAGAAGAHNRDPVLVVTEGDGALEAGAVINFVVVDGNVRFEVSLPAAEQRGLKLSSRLLNVALRVEKSGSAPKREESATNALAAAGPAAQANGP
jgi:hypothetical protein